MSDHYEQKIANLQEEIERLEGENKAEYRDYYMMDMKKAFHANNKYYAEREVQLKVENMRLSMSEEEAQKYALEKKTRIKELEADNKKLLECVNKIARFAESELVKKYANETLTEINEIRERDK